MTISELNDAIAKLLNEMREQLEAEWVIFAMHVIERSGVDVNDDAAVDLALRGIETEIKLEAADTMQRNRGGWSGGNAVANNAHEAMRAEVASRVYSNAGPVVFKAMRKIAKAKE